MSSADWLQRVARFVSSAVGSEGNDADAARQRSRLTLEPMEDRTVPAVFTVTNLADTGVGTLRQAVLDAEATTEADTIKFATNLTGTIKLSAVGDTSDIGPAAFGVNTPITIDGLNGAAGITIARDSLAANMRLFNVGSAGSLTLQGVTLSNGVARGVFSETNETGKGLGGAIYSEGTVTVRGSSFVGNDAVGANGVPAELPDPEEAEVGDEEAEEEPPTVGSTDSGNGEGGAIYNNGGTLTVQGSTFSGNRAMAGTPATGGESGDGRGGAIFNRNGTVTVQSSTLTENRADQGGRQIFSLADVEAATLTINASILGQSDADFSDLVAAAANGGTSTATGGTNLIRSAAGFDGTLTLNADPLLGPLANNGGPTKTHLPQEGSPVLDVGVDSNGQATDQRGAGFARTSNRKADLGSVEVQVAVVREEVSFATGTGTGSAPHVQVLDQDGNLHASFFAYDPAFTGGVNVALGDVNGDGVKDILTAPKDGYSHVKVFDGATGAELHSFFAYSTYSPDAYIASSERPPNIPLELYDPIAGPGLPITAFLGDFNIASGDVNGDGYDDIVTVLNDSVAHVKAFSGLTGEELQSYFAYDPQFTGGASLAVADMNNDGFADIITGANGAPHVRTISGATGRELASFFALDARLATGVAVTTGDINGDERPDYIVTPKAQSNGVVVALDGTTRTKIKAFQTLDGAFADGMSLAARDLNNDGVADLIVGPPKGFPGQVKLYDGATSTSLGNFQPYTLDYMDGITIG